MFIHKLGGSWLDHPFWKQAFLLADAKQIRRIAQSGIHDIWIDTSRGLDVAVAPTEVTVDEAEAQLLATMVDPFALAGDPHESRLVEELARARAIVGEARGAMKAMFEDVRLGKAIDSTHCLPIVKDITGSIERNRDALMSLARLKTSDDYTYMHSVAVCALMVALGRQLELDDVTIREAGVAGLVHDLGKALMPSDVLNKRGPLTPEEFAIMRGHPEAGHRLLLESRGFGPTSHDVCLHHHEKLNGKGYPQGLAGDRISLVARMGAVCDVYDAITSNRCYKPGWDPARSIREMAQWSREGHFDDRVFQAFVKSVGIYPVGSLVRLASDRLAVIVDQSRGSLLKPVVRAIVVVATRDPCDERIDLADPDCEDRIVSRESPADWGLTGIDEYWTGDR